MFRLLRVLRLLRLFTIRSVLSAEGVRDAAVISSILVLAGGAAFAAIEHLTTWNGIWWAMNTVSTLGASGITPSTTGGRVIAIVIMLVGIGFVAMVTAFVADRFIHNRTVAVPEGERQVLVEMREIRERLERLESRPDHISADRD